MSQDQRAFHYSLLTVPWSCFVSDIRSNWTRTSCNMGVTGGLCRTRSSSQSLCLLMAEPNHFWWVSSQLHLSTLKPLTKMLCNVVSNNLGRSLTSSLPFNKEFNPQMQLTIFCMADFVLIMKLLVSGMYLILMKLLHWAKRSHFVSVTMSCDLTLKFMSDPQSKPQNKMQTNVSMLLNQEHKAKMYWTNNSMCSCGSMHLPSKPQNPKANSGKCRNWVI